MITSIFMLPQTLPGAMLIFLIFRFPPEALLVLILIFPEKVRRSWTLIPYIPYSLFCDIFFFLLLGLIAGISLFIVGLVSRCHPCHVNAEREVQLSPCRPVMMFHHVYTRKRLSVYLHGGLAQDQSALFNSRLDLPTELLAITRVVSKGVMPFTIRSPF
jgi:hypothetical protein